MNCIEVPVPSACLRHFSWQMRWRPYHEESKVHVGRHIWSQYSVEHLAGLSQNKWRITIRNIQTVRDPIVCFPKPAYPPKKYESMVANGILLQSSSEGHWEMAVQPWRAAKSNIEGEKEGLCWQKDFWRIKTQRIFLCSLFQSRNHPFQSRQADRNSTLILADGPIHFRIWILSKIVLIFLSRAVTARWLEYSTHRFDTLWLLYIILLIHGTPSFNQGVVKH